MRKKALSKSSRINDNKTIYYIFIFLISVFMLIIPFYKGLFFRINYIPAIAFVSILFAVYMVYKLRDREYKSLDTYMDILALMIPVAYLISFIFAVNSRDALDIFLIYCSYFMLYKLTSDISSKDERYKKIFINVLIASTFILSFTAILAISGLVDIKGAFVGKRIYGLYQYANTTASVFGVGIILSLNKRINEKNIKKAALYQLILTALISSFIFTLSRGGYLVLAGVLLLNFLLIKSRAKLKMLLSIFVSFLSSSVLIYKFYSLPKEGTSGIMVHYLISIIASAIIVFMIYSLKDRVKPKLSDRLRNIAIITMAVVFTGLAAFIFTAKEPIEYRIEHQASEKKSWKYKTINLDELEKNSEYTMEMDVKASAESPKSYGLRIRSYNNSDKRTELTKSFESTGSEFVKKSITFTTLSDTERVQILLYNYESASYTVYKNILIKDSNGIEVKKMERLKYVPAAIANRLANINLETKNVTSRIYFLKDGLKIIKDYPIAGAGGGAWKNLYRHYQSIPYNTTEVHNFYVQYGTEVGITGLAVLGGLLILIAMSFIKAIKSDSQYLYVYIAAILLFMHSMIDFNLSLAAVGYILWMLIGVISSDKNSSATRNLPQKQLSVLLLLTALIVFSITSFTYYGMRSGYQGTIAYNKDKNEGKAIGLIEKAISFDKYNGTYRMELAQIMSNKLKKTKDKKYYDGIIEQISLIRKYEPYNHIYTPVMCNIYLSAGRFEEAAKLADTKLYDEPMLAQSYALKIDVNYELANYYLKDKKVQDAIPYLEKILEAGSDFEEVNKNLKTPMELTEDYPKKLEATQRTLDMIKADMK